MTVLHQILQLPGSTCSPKRIGGESLGLGQMGGGLILGAFLIVLGGCGSSATPSQPTVSATQSSAIKPEAVRGAQSTESTKHHPAPEPLPQKFSPQATERDWQWIVLHHSATISGNVETIHESHLKNKDSKGTPWLGIGYHFVIGNGQGMEDGLVEPTFRWRQQLHGAHAGLANYNHHGIGIVLIGNFEQSTPTTRQQASLARLIETLTDRYAIDSDAIVGHGSLKATECPGRNFPLQDLRDRVAARRSRLSATGSRLTAQASPVWDTLIGKLSHE